MQSRLSPDKSKNVSRLGIYQSILNPAVLQICKIGYFSVSNVRLPILALCIQSWSLKNGLWCFGTVICCNHVYIGIFIQGKQVPIKFSEQFSNTVLCLWELNIAVNYTCLWWVRSVVFFVSVLGNISVYALVVFITLSVLLIFSNLTFPDTKHSGF